MAFNPIKLRYNITTTTHNEYENAHTLLSTGVRMDFLKVSSKSSPASVAGAIAGMVKDGVPCTMQAIGAGAVNQAIKAVAIARGFLIPTGIDISCAPTFTDISIGGEMRTALRISIYVHPITIQGSSQAVPLRNSGASET